MILETGRSPAQQALLQIGRIIERSPDSSGGIQLRRFLWSLYDTHHLVNLWELASRVSGEPARLAAQVFQAALDGNLSEGDIRRTLTECGETD